MNLYQINYTTRTGFTGAEIVTSLGALDALEEWCFDNEELSKDVLKLSIEFVRVAQ